MKRGVPDNVKIYTESKPTLFDKESMAILPAPLHHKRSFHDTTEYMGEVNLSVTHYTNWIGSWLSDEIRLK